MKLTNLLASTAFFTVNKAIVKKVGVNAALLLSDLISKENYFIEKGLTTKDDFFFNTLENIEKDTTLSEHKIRQAIKTLCKADFIEYKRLGIPAKTHIKILHIKLLNFLSTRPLKIESITNKNKINTNVLINKNKGKRFAPPTLEEAILYFKERKSTDIEAEKFIDFYTSKDWFVGRNKMKDWRASVRNWLRRNSEKEEASNSMPNYYSAKFERTLQGSELTDYHKLLRANGWTCKHSPTAGAIWRKK